MAIFTHVCVGSNDLEKANKFYTEVLGALGIQNFGKMGESTTTLYGVEGGSPEFAVLSPANGEAATYANGGTIGFIAANRAAVDAFHAAGMANGGSDEGEPGPRPFSPTAYGCYLRDPDGNKICAYSFTDE